MKGTSLRERYAIKNERKAIEVLFFFCIAVCIFVWYSTLARYEILSSGYLDVDVAGWKITLNGQTLSGKDRLMNCIILVPTTAVDEAKPLKIKPGQSGYFDIKLNPSGTEVSFEYELFLDIENTSLPSGFTISGYSVDGGAVTAFSPTAKLSGSLLLGEKTVFTDSDAKTIKFFWTWTGDEADAAAAYRIAVYAELSQITV